MPHKTMHTKTPKRVTEHDERVTQKDTVRRILSHETTGMGADTQGKPESPVPGNGRAKQKR
jgi:hypothetical protein